MPPCEHSAGRKAGHGPAATPAQGRGAPPAAPHPLRGPRPPGSCALAGRRLPDASKDPPHRPLWARGARSNHVKTRPGSGSERGAVQVGVRVRGKHGPGSGERGRGPRARGPRALGRRPPQARPARREAAATHSEAVRPGLKMAGRHSPVTPPPSPPPRSASRAVRCRRWVPSHAAPGTDADAQP